jgi:hypothetical protein
MFDASSLDALSRADDARAEFGPSEPLASRKS